MSSEGPEGFFEFPRVGSGEFLSEEGVSQDVWGHMLFPRWVGGGVSRSGLALSQIIWHSRWHPARGDREPKLSLHHLQMRILLTTRAEIPSAWLQGRRIYCDPARLIFCSPSHARCCFLNSGLKTEPLSVRFLVRGFFCLMDYQCGGRLWTIELPRSYVNNIVKSIPRMSQDRLITN